MIPKISESMLVCCKLYISEGRNSFVIDSIERAAKQNNVAVINKCVDEIYNRTNYTLVTHSSTNSLLDTIPLQNAVIDMVKTAFDMIDMRLHEGTHPRLGVVDHILFHPLGASTLDQAAELCKLIAADIGRLLKVPVYLYGAAHSEGRALDSIRRELCYFLPNSEGHQWIGDLNTDISFTRPDEGPVEIDPSKGLITIGASMWVGTCNVPIHSEDIELVKHIARSISEKGGGLPSVQAIGVAHGVGSCEVACYLLDLNKVRAGQVQTEVERICSELGVDVGKVYMTDFVPEEIPKLYAKAIESCIAAKI
ncbi:folic acid binding / transferase [Rhynchospora pubera]|uniref:Folic acid binding / transferase n=1 Tax=Rhynchospora pubera TaxID=906938 RepID=A0AAV8HKG8_9POAL|nr:folic acid binding / transferase [Rhynchospora pubera]KAJ4816345.1 folic acid binding / transferase [Rhynchospora pubera]